MLIKHKRTHIHKPLFDVSNQTSLAVESCCRQNGSCSH